MTADRKYIFPKTRTRGFRRPHPKAVGLGELMEELPCGQQTIASVAATSKPAVSPAISPSVSPASSREKVTNETQGSKQGNKSGSKSGTTKSNCYACKYRCDLVGNAHSQCLHPGISGSDRIITPLLICSGKTAPAQKRLNVYGDEHGIKMGWFLWPVSFDPVWLLSCDGFVNKEARYDKP